ncbi:MAG: hypothetical protein ACRC1R_12465 [Cetobacterium sp.]|uniref:hypothetical protein n=1 Tax=Cetobacterium sp. TaxID=2071632 RepID=UPI003F2B6501
MKKLILLAMLVLTMGIYGEEITPVEEGAVEGGIAATSSGTTISKGDSFMVAFGMGGTSVEGGEAGGGITGGGSSASVATTTVATHAASHLANQGIQPPFTPYTYQK